VARYADLSFRPPEVARELPPWFKKHKGIEIDRGEAYFFVDLPAEHDARDPRVVVATSHPNVTMELLNHEGLTVSSGVLDADSRITLETSTLAAGRYYLRISPASTGSQRHGLLKVEFPPPIDW